MEFSKHGDGISNLGTGPFCYHIPTPKGHGSKNLNMYMQYLDGDFSTGITKISPQRQGKHVNWLAICHVPPKSSRNPEAFTSQTLRKLVHGSQSGRYWQLLETNITKTEEAGVTATLRCEGTLQLASRNK